MGTSLSASRISKQVERKLEEDIYLYVWHVPGTLPSIILCRIQKAVSCRAPVSVQVGLFIED